MEARHWISRLAARTAYAAETGKKQSGSVSVTLPSYKISVNGAQINNKEEKYPIFNYNGITYFPLTWAYAVDSFGWSYQWDAVNGLRIDTSSAPAPAPVEPGTGDAALDKALTILNSKYATGGKYHGMLEGGGKKTGFDAALDVSSTPVSVILQIIMLSRAVLQAMNRLASLATARN